MASRPVYSKSMSNGIFRKYDVDFTFFAGFSLKQKQRCVESLHKSFMFSHSGAKVLEVSSASVDEIGVKLSAFNLCVTTKSGVKVSVESMFQGSKVFENGGPYVYLFEKSSREAKKDTRIRESGKLIGFNFCGKDIPTNPKTLFYHWLYINTLVRNPNLAEQLLEYDAFTDISFNPHKSINCQAESCAIFVSLVARNLLEEALSSLWRFSSIVYGNVCSINIENDTEFNISEYTVAELHDKYNQYVTVQREKNKMTSHSIDTYNCKVSDNKTVDINISTSTAVVRDEPSENKVDYSRVIVGAKVNHPKKFGEGEIVSIDEKTKYMVVKFSIGEKKFLMDQVFKNGFLELE